MAITYYNTFNESMHTIDTSVYNDKQLSLIRQIIMLNLTQPKNVIFTVLIYLTRHDPESASNVLRTDLDKVRSYDELYSLLKTEWDKTFPNHADIYWGS